MDRSPHAEVLPPGKPSAHEDSPSLPSEAVCLGGGITGNYRRNPAARRQGASVQSELKEHALRGVAGGKPEASRDTSVRPVPDDEPDSSVPLGVLGVNVSQSAKHSAQEVLNTEELGNKSNTSPTPRAVPAPPTESPACAPKRPPPTNAGFRPHSDPPVELSHSAPRTEAVDPPRLRRFPPVIPWEGMTWSSVLSTVRRVLFPLPRRRKPDLATVNDNPVVGRPACKVRFRRAITISGRQTRLRGPRLKDWNLRIFCRAPCGRVRRRPYVDRGQ